ncbi:MAG: exosortase, partial [Desulfobacteraceae bacterium]|nr:exosortase [Desulfobacteraceae bacterium]
MTKKLFPTDLVCLILVYVLLIGALYYSTLQYLWGMWKADDYSHSLLIPFVILYILWEKRKELSSIPSQPSWWGILFLIMGLTLFWIGELGGEFLTLNFSLWFVILGLLVLHLGRQKIMKIAFVLVLLFTMIPLPKFLYNQISLKLKLVSSQIGVFIMQVYGMSAFREGNIIDLGFARLQVVDACSGLRYLFPMIVLSILVAYFYKANILKRLFVVISSVPLTILTNGLRIAFAGILSEKFGSKVIEGFFHDFE